MYETGRWRREVVRRYPDTASPRYLAPPVAVLGIVVGLVSGLVGLGTRSRLLQAGFAAPAGYVALVVAGSMVGTPPLPLATRLRLPLVLAATHMAWGLGFLAASGSSPLAPERAVRS